MRPRQAAFRALHHSGFSLLNLLSVLTPLVTPNTRSTTSSVAKTVTMHVRVVMVETWHPSGRVLISHRSAQCGQMFSSYAGANAGMAWLFGTQLCVCLY